MKQYFYFFFSFVTLFLTTCSTTDYSPYSYSNEETIYSAENSTSFREILLILVPYITEGDESLYLVTDTIRNVEIHVNDQLWGVFNSFGIDSSRYEYANYNGLFFSISQTCYQIVAPYVTSSDTLFTAGEYADLLNGYFTLEPGDYFCEIASFELITSQNQVIKVYPGLIIPFEVHENSRSTFIGQYEVLLNI
jgi:hypothetical protein